MAFPLAAIGIGLGTLGAGLLDSSSQRKALDAQRRQREQSLQFIQQMMNQSRGDLFSQFPQAQNSRMAGLLSGVNAYQSAFPEILNQMQSGNYAGQQALIGGLGMQNAALMGQPINMNMMQPQRLPINAQALAGMFNAPQFSQIQGG